MNPVELLHDRITRGETLTAEEQSQLNEWYAELERDESMNLFGTPSPPESLTSEKEQIVELHQQIDELLIQLSEKTQYLQQVMEQNRVLRKEVVLLRSRIAKEIGYTIA